MNRLAGDRNIICPLERSEENYFCSINDCCAYDNDRDQCLYKLVIKKFDIKRNERGSPDSLISYRYNFLSIYERHFKRIYSLNYSILKSKEDAEDITQETFARAYRHLRDIDPRISVFTWLCRVAINLCMDKFRKTKGLKFEQLDTCLSSSQIENKITNLITVVDVGQGIESAEDIFFIQEILQKLPLNYLRILMLRFCDDFSSKQIAEILNTSVSAVDTMLFRAKRRFKEIYRNG